MTSSSQCGDALWHYATTVYQRPGLKDALLALQDRYQVDVVVLLACAYLAEQGRRLGRQEIAALLAASASVREDFVLPLRALRRHCRALHPASPQFQPLYQSLKACELSAERAQIDALAACFSPWLDQQAPSPVAAADNIGAYWRAAGDGDGSDAALALIQRVVAILTDPG